MDLNLPAGGSFCWLVMQLENVSFRCHEHSIGESWVCAGYYVIRVAWYWVERYWWLGRFPVASCCWSLWCYIADGSIGGNYVFFSSVKLSLYPRVNFKFQYDWLINIFKEFLMIFMLILFRCLPEKIGALCVQALDVPFAKIKVKGHFHPGEKLIWCV